MSKKNITPNFLSTMAFTPPFPNYIVQTVVDRLSVTDRTPKTFPGITRKLKELKVKHVTRYVLVF